MACSLECAFKKDSPTQLIFCGCLLPDFKLGLIFWLTEIPKSFYKVFEICWPKIVFLTKNHIKRKYFNTIESKTHWICVELTEGESISKAHPILLFGLSSLPHKPGIRYTQGLFYSKPEHMFAAQMVKFSYPRKSFLCIFYFAFILTWRKKSFCYHAFFKAEKLVEIHWCKPCL